MKLNSTLFSGVPGDVMVHNGFRDAHSATASSILAEVKNLISQKGATSVVAVSPNNCCGSVKLWGVLTDCNPS